jgi:hypothetical protein
MFYGFLKGKTSVTLGAVYIELFLYVEPQQCVDINIQSGKTAILTLMKTLRPAMLYRPSPTFFTFSLLHLLDGQ